MKLARHLYLSPSLSELGQTSRMLLRMGHIPHLAKCFLSLSADGRFVYVYDHSTFKEKWFQKSDETVFGLVATRADADELIAEIVALAVKENGNPEPGPYLSHVLEADDA